MARPRSERELHSINIKLDKLDYEWMKQIYGNQYVSATIRDIIRRHRSQVETAARARTQLEQFNGK